MPDFKEIAKSGWHPKGKDGKGESWRSDFKVINQVAGLVGKGKDSGSSIPAEYRTSRPLSSLKDPASFGPPPKHFHTTEPSQTTQDATSLVEPFAQSEAQQETIGEETKPKAPPVPFRIDTTGLSTSHLPPPPKRKDGDTDAKTPPPPTPKPKPPFLPPRLPPRQGTSPLPAVPQKAAAIEPDVHKGILNQGSLNRLGAAGVSVPGLDIGAPFPTPLDQGNHTPSNNTAQLHELQSRFSRLSPSNSPGPGIPREDTALVRKQNVPKPPPPYRRDLSSPLPHDAMGEQPSGLGKKKPPPPPVKKANLLSLESSNQGGPPLIPSYSKPKPHSVDRDVQDLDLDLKSLWFAKSPPSFPPASINRLPGGRSYASSSGWTSSGVRKIHTFTGAIRHSNTLATTIIHLTWDSSNPGVTIKAKQRHIPPPRKLTSEELDSNRDKYADDIANWCESKMGQQVGDGECWTLANEALKGIGAKASSMGREPCMSSQSYVHGALIYSYVPATSPYPEPKGGVQEAGVARGDIMQLLTAHFKSKDSKSEKWAGAPDHTAVVVGIEPHDVLRMVEQNIGGVKKVREGSYDMSELVKGEVRIFRAVGESWVGKLEPKW